MLDRQRLLSSCKLVITSNRIVTDFYAQLPGNASDPDTTYDDLLPVIYWIHGGAFSMAGLDSLNFSVLHSSHSRSANFLTRGEVGLDFLHRQHKKFKPIAQIVHVICLRST